MDTLGKKILHGVCGAIFGFFAGFIYGGRYFRGNMLIPCIIGSLLLGTIAFFSTDSFWNSLRRD